MFAYSKAALLPLIAMLGLQCARAESSDSRAAARPDPADAGVAVSAAMYQSAFSDYKRLGADSPVSWKAANDEVRLIGGWKAYAREARGASATVVEPVGAPAAGSPDKQGVPAAQKPAALTPGGHDGHPMK
ncbi:MAG: hypothetical protein ABIS68_03880 [Casimicrobiaceae bacterium]